MPLYLASLSYHIDPHPVQDPVARTQRHSAAEQVYPSCSNGATSTAFVCQALQNAIILSFGRNSAVVAAAIASSTQET